MDTKLAPPIDFPLEEVKRRMRALHSISDLIIEAAKKLQKELRIFTHVTDSEERERMDRADQSLGDFLLEYIQKQFPEDSVLIESQTEIEGSNSFRWVLDPVDGTMNFVRGIPLYGISIGLEHRENPVAGTAYIPALGDRYSAILSQGAFKNGLRIDVSATQSLSRSLLVSSFPSNRKEILNEVIADLSAFISTGRSMRRTGSFVLDVCWVSEGRLDGIWETNVKPWDTSAVYVILTEAGGKITDFQGNHYLPNFTEIVASNAEVHNQIIETLRTVRSSIGRN